MFAMSWNVCGLGKLAKRRKVKSVVLTHKPLVLFLQESKLGTLDNKTFRDIGGCQLSRGIGVAADGSAGVIDIPLWEMSFTWSNNREVGSWARLDRFLVSPIILSWCPNLVQIGLPISISDHCAINLGVSKDNWGLRPFRFFNKWLEDKVLLAEVVKDKDKTSTKAIEEKLAKLDNTASSMAGRRLCVKKGSSVASGRRRNNFIEDLSLEGVKKSSPDEVKKGVADFFKKHYKKESWRRPTIGGVLQLAAYLLANSRWRVKRDLRQGDPLSSFLFNVAVEGLSALLRKVASMDMLKGIFFGDETVHVSHLQFADGTILFLQPKAEYLRNARRIFRCFELASGMSLNFNKSCLVHIGKRGEADTNWAAIFRCAKGGKKRKIHSLKWELLCKSKHDGGLGLGSILHKNKSLLVKWVWRFGAEEAPLWKKVICAKYCVSTEILRWDWNCGIKSSAFTKAVGNLFRQGNRSAHILEEGLKVVVGRGDRARLWSDIMVEDISLKVAFPRIYTLAVKKSGRIRYYWKCEGSEGMWEIILRRPLFNWEVEQWECCRVCLESVIIRDSLQRTISWVHDAKGFFSVKSFINCLRKGNSREEAELGRVWQGLCPPKIEIFVWQLLYGRVMVRLFSLITNNSYR
ncbi:hypothetical protein Ddye_011330 [Dipteronia dyeriana]|uniref:Reverse transcriptase domain-containing protein n=1 Tax=Dipteronia dyeriana TaxID=168575 RepID=A0AAE0CGR2_9ROSI|nr:hypothetical protein Ddye_011330 [Dipteronia dyeriana]